MPWKTFTAYSSRVSGLTVGPTLRTAGDVQDLAGGEPGALADEERHRMGDVLRHPGAGDRDLREERGLELLEVHARPLGGRHQHLGLDEARGNRVHGHTESAELDRERLGESLEASLGGRVVGLAAVS
jgi:hypothetical protein